MLPRAIPIPTAAAPGAGDVPQLQDIVQSGVLRISQRAAESPAGGRDDVSEQNGHMDDLSIPGTWQCARHSCLSLWLGSCFPPRLLQQLGLDVSSTRCLEHSTRVPRLGGMLSLLDQSLSCSGCCSPGKGGCAAWFGNWLETHCRVKMRDPSWRTDHRPVC